MSQAHTPQLLLVGHGSRDPRFADTVRRVRHAVEQRLPDVNVTLAFLDLDEPLVGDALDHTTGDCVVVPLLLAPGYHSEIDLPGIVDAHRGERTVAITPVVGGRGLTQALAHRLVEAGTDDGDGILLTAVGSSKPMAALVARRRAIELSTLLHRPVEVVFATQLGTDHVTLRNAVRRLHTAGARRIAVSPYFLSAGLLTERVENALDRFTANTLFAGPIGAHPALVETIVLRYQASVSAATLVARA